MKTEMNIYQKILGVILLGSILVFGFVNVSLAAKEAFISDEYNEFAGDEDEDEDEEHQHRNQRTIKQDALYVEECGSCHLAYPAALLPPQSWRAIMRGLENHFDENAELDDETMIHISQFLQKNALKNDQPSKFSRMLRNSQDRVPLRITKLSYFINEHDEIPKNMVINNPEVVSYSNCDSCHQDAVGGFFDEDQVIIPGFGRWDD